MTPNHRKLLAMCIEDGVARGLVRASKHVEKPDDQQIKQSIEHCIWEEIDDWFDWQAGVQ